MKKKIRVARKLGDEYQCYCLVNEEKVPSLFINPTKNMVHCFSCGRGGTAEELLKEYDLGDIEIKVSSSFWTPATNHGKGTEGYKYMRRRGFSPDTLDDWEVLCTDQYVLIPVKTRKGDTVGLIFRHWDEEKPKYLYNKGFKAHDYLFGSSHYIPDDFAFVVEGALDVMWLHQHGFRNSVAILGTRLSETQIKLLHKLTDGVCLCFDNDVAGRDATYRAIKQLRIEGFEVKVLVLPREVKDLKELSSEQLIEVCGVGRISYLRYLLENF